MSTVFPSSMPYDDVTIIDQSGYVEEMIAETPFIPDGPVAFVPFISPRGYGEDNKLQYMTASKLAKYGNPNLKKYGLSLYLAKQVIAAGGTVLGMRVTTNSYKHANLCVSAEVSKTKKIRCETRTSADGKTTYHPIFTNNGTEYVFEEITIDDPTNIETSKVLMGNNTKLIYDFGHSGQSSSENFSIKIGETIEDARLELTLDTSYGTSSHQPVVDFLVVVDTTAYALTYDNSLTVKYITSYATEATDLEAVNGALTKDYTKLTDADINSWNGSAITIPLFYVAAKGAGLYGNAFKVRFTVDNSMNSYNDTVNGSGYFYKFIDSDGNSKLDNTMSFTFNDDYVYQNESMSVEEVFGKYTENVVMAKTKYFNDFVKIVKKYCCDKSNPAHKVTDINNVDLLFGENMDKEVYKVDLENGIDLSIETGLAFNGGTEEENEFSFNNDPYAGALTKAFDGTITDLIYDQVRFPFQFIFCPSANSSVTEAVHKLVTKDRKITSAYYFICGDDDNVIPKTYTEARAATNPGSTYKEMTVPEWARITDPYTNKKTFMPSVYFNAYSIINHWNNRKGKPLAGRLNAIWSGFDVGTVTPSSSNTGEYVSNHNAHMNTMIEDGLGNAELYEQISAQATTSSLSEMNNVQVLHEMVKIALRLAKDHRWSDLGANDITTYQRSTEEAISNALKGCYERMEVVATRESSNGAGKNRILCKVNVKFKDIFKGVSYEFYILAQ